MATLHQTSVTPTKPEILAVYLPTIAELSVDSGDELAVLGAYRFDDPGGEVGIESHLLAAADGRTIHMPLTYRAAALEGADKWFVTNLDHGTLGRRWVYNACGDPVYAAALAQTIATGGSQATLEVLTPEGPVERANTVFVRGTGEADTWAPSDDIHSAARSGTDTAISIGDAALVVHHVLRLRAAPNALHLSGSWPGSSESTVLATMSAPMTG